MPERLYATNYESSEVCKTSDTCSMELMVDDQYYMESLEDRVVDQLESLEVASNAWAVIGKNVAEYINQSRKSQENAAYQSSSSRNDRRYSDRNREFGLAQQVARAHNAAIQVTGSGLLQDVYVKNLVTDGAPSKELIPGLEMKILDRQKKRTAAMGAYRAFAIEDELIDAFQLEYLSRANLQLINEEAPEVLQAMFDPSLLMDLPSSLQRIAALDINRGIGSSILLDNAKKYIPGEQSQSVQLADYIRENNLPEGVKKSLLAIKLGMQAMEAPECPFNDLGICTHLLSKLPISSYPEDVQRDITTRTNMAAQKRVESLVAFAKRNPTSKILNSSLHLNDSFSVTSSQSKKRSSAPSLEKRDFVMAEQVEANQPAFEKIVFRFANSGDFVRAESKDVDELNEALEEVLDQEMVKKYSDKYHDDKLIEMLGGAFAYIAIAPSYIGTGRMITPWVDMRNNAHLNEEGVKERYMRYSGARSVGISGGPVGKDTRIIFSQGTKNGVRHITIHKIMHKADMKQNLSLR